MSDQQPPAEGWYPDQQGTMRWWDGQAWTEHVAAPAAPTTTGGKVRVGRLVGGIVLLLLMLGGLSNANQQTFADDAERFGFYLVPLLCLIFGVWLVTSAFTKKK